MGLCALSRCHVTSLTADGIPAHVSTQERIQGRNTLYVCNGRNTLYVCNAW